MKKLNMIILILFLSFVLVSCTRKTPDGGSGENGGSGIDGVVVPPLNKIPDMVQVIHHQAVKLLAMY